MQTKGRHINKLCVISQQNSEIQINNEINMKKNLILLLLVFGSFNVNSQSCDEIMEFVKSKSHGTSYKSYNSDAITKVTFHTVNVDYKTL